MTSHTKLYWSHMTSYCRNHMRIFEGVFLPRLQAMKREIKVKELKVLDAARRRFVQHQQATKEAELKRLDDDIQRKVLQRDAETRAALDDIEIRALELERQKALLENELTRCHEEVCAVICAVGQ